MTGGSSQRRLRSRRSSGGSGGVEDGGVDSLRFGMIPLVERSSTARRIDSWPSRCLGRARSTAASTDMVRWLGSAGRKTAAVIHGLPARFLRPERRGGRGGASCGPGSARGILTRRRCGRPWQLGDGAVERGERERNERKYLGQRSGAGGRRGAVLLAGVGREEGAPTRACARHKRDTAARSSWLQGEEDGFTKSPLPEFLLSQIGPFPILFRN